MEDFSRYNGEGTKLRQVQLRLLKILEQIDIICRRHNIPYWIEYGTLLGAVRHKGFIPWDDDLDVCVMATDYPRLREYLLTELPKQFALQDSGTDSYVWFDHGRIRDRHSHVDYPSFRLMKEQGIWIDLCIVDCVKSIKMKHIIDYLYRRAYREIHHYGDALYSSAIKRIIYKSIGYIIYPLCFGIKKLFSWWSNNSKSVFLGCYMLDVCADWSAEEVFPLTELEFEGLKVFAPGKYKEQLTRIYGDYLQVPPENKRQIHCTDWEIW